MLVELLSAESLVLLALAGGPSAGSEIVERMRALTRDPGLLGAGTLYPVLRRMESTGVVRVWTEDGRSRVGRPRRFTELTAAGVQALFERRSLLRALTSPTRPATLSRALVHRMRANLRRAFAVSAFGARLQRGLRRR